MPYDPNTGQPIGQPTYVQQARPDRKRPFIAGMVFLIVFGIWQFARGEWWFGLYCMALVVVVACVYYFKLRDRNE